MLPKLRIELADEGHYFKAFIADKPAIHDKGRSLAEAIGQLILTHREAFPFEIEYPGGSKSRPPKKKRK